MVLDIINVVLNLIVVVLLAIYAFKKPTTENKDLYGKYRNQDGLLIRNRGMKNGNSVH